MRVRESERLSLNTHVCMCVPYGTYKPLLKYGIICQLFVPLYVFLMKPIIDLSKLLYIC